MVLGRHLFDTKLGFAIYKEVLFYFRSDQGRLRGII